MKQLWYFKTVNKHGHDPTPLTSLVLMKNPLAAEITYGVFNCLVYKMSESGSKMPSHSSIEAQVLALNCMLHPTNSLKPKGIQFAVIKTTTSVTF